MGCATSQSNGTKVTSVDRWTEDVMLVRDTWAEVKDGAGLEGFAMAFNGRLGENKQLEHTLFRGVDTERQSSRLTALVDLAVERLDNDDSFNQILIPLGERHAGYGVEDEHYPIIGGRIRDCVIECIGDESFTERRAEAWDRFYDKMANSMMTGARTERGQQLLGEYQAKEATESTKFVKDSWARFAALDNAEVLISEALAAAPEAAAAVFGGGDTQAKQIISLIDTAVAELDGAETPAESLRKQGAAMAPYVAAEHYPALGAAVLAAVAAGIDEDFNGDMEFSWEWAIRTFSGHMTAGIAAQIIAV